MKSSFHSETTIPAGVHAAIRAQQQESEILIGWVQLVVVGAFGTLYAISPKAFPPEVTFHPIPWVLSAYFLFTIARMALAYRRELPRWFLVLSVGVDMAILLGMIWSFHLQYMQPAAFYLKAPTMLYVFIFIALRTLRFEPMFVLLAGSMAAVGWGLMTSYALWFDPIQAPVTRDYVQYLTTNSILIGAEFDRVISIVVVTGILAIAIVRARRLLVTAVTEKQASQALSRFFDHDIARQITDSDFPIEPGRGVTRDAAIAYIDMRDFSKWAAEMPADDLIELLSEYQSTVVPVLRSHGGSIDKFLGDGIMATFGATQRSETSAADAVRAVMAVVAELAAWRADRRRAGLSTPRIGAAIASGAVIFGAVGDGTHLEYTVIGHSVNLAAKLEKQTKIERVRALTDRATWDLALRQGFESGMPPDVRSNRTIMGLETPIDLVVLANFEAS